MLGLWGKHPCPANQVRVFKYANMLVVKKHGKLPLTAYFPSGQIPGQLLPSEHSLLSKQNLQRLNFGICF
jgi:hypothetical protein